MARPAFKFELRGVKELNNALKQLPKSVGKSVLRSALTKAAEPVRAEAQRLAPVDSRLLVESIVVKSTLKKSQRRGSPKVGAVQMFIGPTAPHGFLVEFGTNHSAPQPFLRPAWESRKEQVTETLEREIWAALSRAAKRLAKQAATGKLSRASRRHFGG